MKIKDQNMFLTSCIVGTIIFLLVVFKPFKFENETKVLNNSPSGNSYSVGNTANNNNGVKEENVQTKDVTVNTRVVTNPPPQSKYIDFNKQGKTATAFLQTDKFPPELQKELDDLRERIEKIEQKAFEKESK